MGRRPEGEMIEVMEVRKISNFSRRFLIFIPRVFASRRPRVLSFWRSR
jgi:hypothetical protein